MVVRSFFRQRTDPNPGHSRNGCGHAHTSNTVSCVVPPWPRRVPYVRIGAMDLLNTLVEKGLRRELPTREEALAVLATSDDELLEVVAAAGKVRRQWFGRRVK